MHDQSFCSIYHHSIDELLLWLISFIILIHLSWITLYYTKEKLYPRVICGISIPIQASIVVDDCLMSFRHISNMSVQKTSCRLACGRVCLLPIVQSSPHLGLWSRQHVPPLTSRVAIIRGVARFLVRGGGGYYLNYSSCAKYGFIPRSKTHHY